MARIHPLEFIGAMARIHSLEFVVVMARSSALEFMWTMARNNTMEFTRGMARNPRMEFMGTVARIPSLEFNKDMARSRSVEFTGQLAHTSCLEFIQPLACTRCGITIRAVRFGTICFHPCPSGGMNAGERRRSAGPRLAEAYRGMWFTHRSALSLRARRQVRREWLFERVVAQRARVVRVVVRVVVVFLAHS